MKKRHYDNNIYPAFKVMYDENPDAFEACKENPGLFTQAVAMNNRFMVTSYLRENNQPVAVTVLMNDCLVGKIPSFNLLYAVDPAYWQLGYGTKIVQMSIDQFQRDMRNARLTPKIPQLYVTTYVGVNNLVSQKISRKCLSTDFSIIKDSMSGEAQYYYKRLLDI